MNVTLIYILSFVMVAAGVGFIYAIVGGNRSRWPEGGIQWLGVGLSAVLIALAGTIIVITAATDFDGSDMTLASSASSRVELDVPAQNFSFRLVEDDRARELSTYDGSVILLNFWATWCAPCLEELPALNRLQDMYRDAGLVVLTLSDEHPETLKDFETSMPLRTVSGYVEEPEALPPPFDEMNNGRPVSFVIDSQGYVREFVLGAGSYPYFEKTIRPYLPEG